MIKSQGVPFKTSHSDTCILKLNEIRLYLFSFLIFFIHIDLIFFKTANQLTHITKKNLKTEH